MKHGWIILQVLLVCFFSINAANAVPRLQDNSKKESLIIELTGKDPAKVDEQTLYSEIVASFQSDDGLGFNSRSQNFLSRFSQSIYADNVLFMNGRYALDKKLYGKAISYFNRIIKEYPLGDKVIAAKFWKGMTFERMNLLKEAKLNLLEVKNKYPGSPESFRAENELKILGDFNSAGRR